MVLLASLFLPILLSQSVLVQAHSLHGYEWTYSDVRDLDYKIYPNADYFYEIRVSTEDAADSWGSVVESGCPDFNRITSDDYLIYISETDVTSGALAYTYRYPDYQTGYYTLANIDVNEYWFDINYYNGDGEHVQEVMCHELGHVLGLQDYSGAYIMNPTDWIYTSLGIFEPQTDDINGVDAIYG